MPSQFPQLAFRKAPLQYSSSLTRDSGGGGGGPVSDRCRRADGEVSTASDRLSQQPEPAADLRGRDVGDAERHAAQQLTPSVGHKRWTQSTHGRESKTAMA